MYDNILNVCLELHQANTGSHEPDMSKEEYRKKYDFLMERIKKWTPPHPKSSLFDSSVATVILATLKECDLKNG